MAPRFLALLLLLPSILPATATADLKRTDVFVSGQDGYHTYRIPAIIRARNGDLLAFCEGRRDSGGDTGNIDLLLKRSSDGGLTWSAAQVVWDDGDNTCGNPCPVVDASTGEVILLACHNPGPAHEADITARASAGTRTIWVLRSGDDGHTWSAPEEITKAVKQPKWGWYATGPGVSIQLQSGPHAGRIVVPCNHGHHAAGQKITEAHVIYSDDHGHTWQLGGSVGPETNESQIAELFDGQGTILDNMRSYAGRHCRAQSTSADGGATWSPLTDATTLVEPVCQASLLRWPRAADGQGVLLFSNPADPEKRRTMTVRASADGGLTWPSSVVLEPGPAAYSCLIALDAQTAGCLFETGPKRPYAKIVFVRFDAKDLSLPPVASAP